MHNLLKFVVVIHIIILFPIVDFPVLSFYDNDYR